MACRRLILPPPNDCRFRSAMHCRPGGNSSSSHAPEDGERGEDADSEEEEEEEEEEEGDGRTMWTARREPSANPDAAHGSQAPEQQL